MKVIDFNKKIAEVEGELISSVPKVEMSKKEIVVNEHKLKLALKIISNELLKDPVIVSMMNLRNNPSPSSMETFLSTVKTNIDYATSARYKDYLGEVFTVKEVKNDQAV